MGVCTYVSICVSHYIYLAYTHAQAIDESQVSARVVVIGYNASLGAEKDCVVEYAEKPFINRTVRYTEEYSRCRIRRDTVYLSHRHDAIYDDVKVPVRIRTYMVV